ncbi:hypothetical protein ACFSTC_08590 [Nonomuraea ferruginea]
MYMSGLARLVAGDLAEQAGEVGVEGRVHAERCGGEERVEVEVAPAVAGVDEPRALAEFEVEYEPVSVDEQVAGKAGVNVHVSSAFGRTCHIFPTVTRIHP